MVERGLASGAMRTAMKPEAGRMSRGWRRRPLLPALALLLGVLSPFAAAPASASEPPKPPPLVIS